jgi:alcohol dehydrogenase class IV
MNIVKRAWQQERRRSLSASKPCSGYSLKPLFVVAQHLGGAVNRGWDRKAKSGVSIAKCLEGLLAGLKAHHTHAMVAW